MKLFGIRNIMIKNISIRNISRYVCGFCVVVMMLASCASTDSVMGEYGGNKQKLIDCPQYTAETHVFEFKDCVDEMRAAEIRAYFKANAGLDLEAVAAAETTTWEKAVELAVFVAKNIPHDNQKEPLAERNAISLWEYSRRVPTGFNCRWHGTILSELLLSIGIKNFFATCLPAVDDGDCHVVNVVWLPEEEKWAMIDSDMLEYAVGEDGKVLSLQEMREYIRGGKTFAICALPGFDDSWIATVSGKEYMQAYWTKNLYWFAAHTTYAFDLEGNRTVPDEYVCLVPPGFDCSNVYADNPVTTSDEAFWNR